MGRSPAKKAQPQQAEQRRIEVDPNRIINRLRQQRSELEAQLDIISAALEESQEREQQMLERIAELEDKAEEKKD